MKYSEGEIVKLTVPFGNRTMQIPAIIEGFDIANSNLIAVRDNGGLARLEPITNIEKADEKYQQKNRDWF